jgi:uncharacterized protein (DUF3820 family)
VKFRDDCAAVFLRRKTRSSRGKKSGSVCKQVPADRPTERPLWFEKNSWPAGKCGDADKPFAAVQALAASKGLRYMPIDQVAQLRLDRLLERIKTIAKSNPR